MLQRASHSSLPSPTQLKNRFEQLTKEQLKSRQIVDTVEEMGKSFLSLDGTPYDQDPAKDSVAFEKDGVLAYVEGVKDLDLVFTLNVLDQRGGDSKEYSKDLTLLSEPDVWGDTYTLKSHGQTETVVQSKEGVLTYLQSP